MQMRLMRPHATSITLQYNASTSEARIMQVYENATTIIMRPA